MQLVTIWSRRGFGGALLGAVLAPLLGRSKVLAHDGPHTHEVAIRNFVFEPATLTIKPGDTVQWTNEDIAPHTASGRDGSWDTGTLKKGNAGSVTFADVGSNPYFCRFHPNMLGEVIVVENG